jgi:hypothetical protein
MFNSNYNQVKNLESIPTYNHQGGYSFSQFQVGFEVFYLAIGVPTQH